MKVSEKVISEYKSNSKTRHVTLHFPELGINVGMESIHFETMELQESLVEDENIEFVGCIASQFKINVNGLKQDVKDMKIVVDICTDDTLDEPITLFNGIVYSALKTGNKQVKEIIAYDALYTKGDIEVAAWYKSQKFPETIRDFRYSLFAFLGIEQVEIALPNDDILLKKQYDPNTLQAISVIKAICQINGVFGIMNREGKFEYRIPSNMYDDGTYPGLTLFPGEDTFPGASTVTSGIDTTQIDFSFYKAVKYEEFEVRPVDKVTIRQSEDDAGTTFGDGENNYIIQGNMFSYGLSKDVLKTVAENIYYSVQGFSYYPYKADNNGLPFVECGLNVVTYMIIDYEATFADDNTSGDIIYEEKQFPVLNRNLKGIQAMQDNYTADGEEYQTEFITDLQTQIDILKKKQKSEVTRRDLEDYTYSRDEIDAMMGSGGGGNANIVSVDVLPSYPNPNIFYAVQGMVVVN